MAKLLLYLAVYAVISALGLALLKMSMSAAAGNGAMIPSLLRDWRFLVGFTLYAAGFVMWMVLLQRHELTLVFPMAAGSLFVGVGLMGVLLLQEQLQIGRIIGMAVIVLGVGILSWSR